MVKEAWKTREEMEATERATLAPFAQKSGDSRGRKFSEQSHAYRTEFQRDRARIIHSRAFRRLEYKTQVSGEEILAECMRDHGGFEHNRQSLRVVELLENAYPDFAGLNLTFEVREGLQKHQNFYQATSPGGEKYKCPSLEAQIANLADEITYYSHDLDDAVDFEILTAAQLDENEVWQRSQQNVLSRYRDAREPELHKLIIRDIIDVQVQDVVATSAKSICAANPKSSDDVRKQPAPLIRYSAELHRANAALQKFLYANVYYHPRVAKVNQRACEMLRKVLESYVADPRQLGEVATKRIDQEGLHRTVCDYVAGMTDRYLMEEYARIIAK